VLQWWEVAGSGGKSQHMAGFILPKFGEIPIRLCGIDFQ
jgi:hypothetical protein